MKWVAFIFVVTLGLVEFAVRAALFGAFCCTLLGAIILAEFDYLPECFIPYLWVMANKILDKT